MKKFNAKEYNRLCAEYVGQLKGEVWYHFPEEIFNNITLSYKKSHHMEQLCFDTEWSWIIMVVEKIEEEWHIQPVNIQGNECVIKTPVTFRTFGGNKKEAVVLNIWKFLNWYEKYKSETTNG